MAQTWSYTLTLGMLTNLPMLVFDKNFNSVIKNRLENYDKKYYFSDINDLEELFLKYSQNYLYTINPFIKFDKFWNIIFI